MKLGEPEIEKTWAAVALDGNVIATSPEKQLLWGTGPEWLKARRVRVRKTTVIEEVEA